MKYSDVEECQPGLRARVHSLQAIYLPVQITLERIKSLQISNVDLFIIFMYTHVPHTTKDCSKDV